jgi:ferric enterobactin receptor
MRTFIFFLCLLCFVNAKSQTNPSLTISGKLTDSLIQQPIGFATVLLKNEQKTSVKSVISDKDGAFSLTNLSKGNYSINVVHVGYQNKMINVRLDSTSKILEPINLSGTTSQLKSVTVTADRPLVKQEIDRIAYNVQADPENKVNSVLEMMRKVPMLSVDGDDNIQLQGNSNYRILINGKPSGMMERNPKDILKSMPASSIERIEVITTPPAKYDGEGLAGIINIITYKKVDNGTNGSINMNQRFPVGGPGIGGNFTVKSGKFGVATNAGGSLSSAPLLNNSISRSTIGNTPTNLWQTGARENSGKYGYAGVELSFEIDSLNLLSGQFNYNASSNESANNQFSSLTNGSTLLQRYQLTNGLNGNGDGVDAAFNYQLGFKKDKNRLLTLSYRYYEFSNSQFNQVNIFDKLAYDVPNYKQENIGGTTEQTVQLDYMHPFKKINIEAGLKAIFRDNNSDFQFLSANSSGIFVVDPLRTNIFNNSQNVYAFYNTYQFNLKDWGFKAGIRAEQTEITANFVGLSTSLNNNSFNLTPSISVMRKFKNMISLNFGFTARIQRPGIYQLNPFVDRSNPNFESSGNPDLAPTVGNNFEINYSSFKKLSLNINARAMFFEKLIMPTVTTDPTTNITRSSFGNTGSGSLIGLGVNANYPITTKLRASLNVMGNYGIVQGIVNGAAIKNKGLMRRAFASVSYKASKTLQGTATVNYNGPNLSLQGTTNSFVSSSFSVSKDLFNNKLAFSFAANNVFNKYREAINYTNGPNFIQESYNQNYQRNFTGSVNYRFGKLKESIKKNKKGISNNDVGGSTM